MNTQPSQKVRTNAGKIRQFFHENPGEFLSVDDIAVKFDMTEAQAKSAVKYLAKRKAISRLSVYSVAIADSEFPGVDIDAVHRRASA